MEDLLLNLLKEANGAKCASIRHTAQAAYGMITKSSSCHDKSAYLTHFILCVSDLLCTQNNLLRNPSYELRAACFSAFRLALDTKRNKLVTLALTGLNVSVL